MENNQPINNVSNSIIVGGNVKGNGNHIACNSSSEMINQPIKYIDLLQEKEEQISELIATITNLTNSISNK